ncbi:MAG: hypothetical protein KBA06_01810 [Saprospiraceae bacterium]|nr:hypothetical protein [Saprospiraceae bacterium]
MYRRLTLAILFFSINLIPIFSQDLSKAQVKQIQEFIDCVKNYKKDLVASKTIFPLEREYPIASIKDEQEFVKRYDELFDDKFTNIISKSNLTTDWSLVGWRGIMFLDGDLWLDFDGKLFSINHKSPAEIEKYNALLKKDKGQLYEALRDYVKPVLLLETNKFRIRVDDMGNDKYRYASWKITSKMSTKPDLVIQNGEFMADGSGGNYRYVFTNNEYTYQCYVIETGEADSPPAYIAIYRGDKEILSQEAKIITY